MGLIERGVLALTLPVAVFLAGAWLLTVASGRDQMRTVPREGRPLNQQFGYGVNEVKAQWGSLDAAGLAIERRMLELDLLFPFAYGGALAAGLLIVWAGLGRSFSPALPIGVVALGVLADWTENLVQLGQMDRFSRDGPTGLQPAWIAVASFATALKLTILAVAFAALAVLVVVMLVARRA
jgi:hypothetical protein